MGWGGHRLAASRGRETAGHSRLCPERASGVGDGGRDGVCPGFWERGN